VLGPAAVDSRFRARKAPGIEFADHLHAIGWLPNFCTDSGVQLHELNISDRTVRYGIVLGGLAPGRYRLKVHPDMRLTPDDITIEDGKTNEFTLTWER